MDNCPICLDPIKDGITKKFSLIAIMYIFLCYRVWFIIKEICL